MPNANSPLGNHLSQLKLDEKRERSKKRRFRNRLTLGISLLLIALYSIDLGFDRRSENFARTPNTLNVQKDLLRAAENIEVVFYDQQGHRNLFLTASSAEFGAPHAMEIPDDIVESITPTLDEEEYVFHDERPDAGINHLLLKPVRIFSYKNQQLSATLESNFAFINTLENEIHLSGNIKATNLVNNSQMKTESLSMNTESRHLYGDKLVTIDFNNAHTQAIGVQGYQLDGRWQLLSNVRTTLEIK